MAVALGRKVRFSLKSTMPEQSEVKLVSLWGGGSQGVLMQRPESFEASLSDDGRYRLLVDAITDYAIYMLDAKGVVTSWNPGAERFKGYTAAEIIGRHFSRFYTDEDRSVDLPGTALATAAKEGRFEQEGWRVRKDGSRFWALVVIDPIWSPQGNLMGYAKVTRDLSERREAAEAMRRREQEFQRLVEGVIDYAIYMLDPSGYISTWNAGAERAKGYVRDEIVGQHFSKFFTSEDRAAELPQRALEIAAREGRFEQEGWRIRKDGARFWANAVIDAVRDGSGKLIGFAKVTRDITERREAQQALEQAQLALFQVQKMDALGQLTGGVAHDFNNLLMAILGSLELAQKRLPEDQKLRSLIDNAIQGAERGASLTQRMLAFARRQDLQVAAVDVTQVVEGMRGLFERTLGARFTIETQFASALPLARTDAGQLEMALLNLLVNARDAMPDGGVIRIVAHPCEADEAHQGVAKGLYVCLSVSDNGVGMDADTLARATEPFFTTKGVGKGTGLGLPMIHGLAKQSGGDMRMRSEPGQGTTVELWLPVADASEIPEAQPEVVETFDQPRDLHVLAIDDDPLVLVNTVAMLADLGHHPVAATSAEEGLALLKSDVAFDLVISDQAMPGMTGVELARRAAKLRPDLPFLLATGYAELSPGDGAELPKLSKPFTQAQLATCLAVTVTAREKA
jgi:PAS domain S-box-containing protein